MQSKMPWVALLGLQVIALGGCSGTADSDPQGLAETAAGSEKISDRLFSRLTVPCADKAAAARALLELTARDLGPDMRTRLVDHEMADVKLRDGRGKIAVIVYAVSAEGETETLTTTEHFLINSSCQVLQWGLTTNSTAT